MTDAQGEVLLRAGNPLVVGDSQAGDGLVAAALGTGEPAVVGTAFFSDARLGLEGRALASAGRASTWWRPRGARPLAETPWRPTAWC